MARALRLVVAVLVAVGLVVVALLVLQGRDRSTFTAPAHADGTGRLQPDQGDEHRVPPPGFRYVTDPPTSGPHRVVAPQRDGGPLRRDELLTALERGNVVLVYARAANEPALRTIAQDDGPFDPQLAAAGQAVLLDRRPGTRGVVALAWRRLLRVGSPSDPRLHAFVDGWLGHGAR